MRTQQYHSFNYKHTLISQSDTSQERPLIISPSLLELEIFRLSEGKKKWLGLEQHRKGQRIAVSLKHPCWEAINKDLHVSRSNLFKTSGLRPVLF